LSGAALVGLELGELGFPKTQDVGGDIAQACHVADAEVELIRDGNWLGGDELTDWVMRSHLSLKYRTARGEELVVSAVPFVVRGWAGRYPVS
jgi:hypothetical protein